MKEKLKAEKVRDIQINVNQRLKMTVINYSKPSPKQKKQQVKKSFPVATECLFCKIRQH